jgi:uroporphyrinogen-III synthase
MAGNTLVMVRQSSDAAVPVLLTRSEGQSTAFARSLTARFGTKVRPVIAPLMRVEILSPDLPAGPFAGVIFTSANAVEAALGLKHLPKVAWCVGDKTAQEARAAGFSARSASGDADALVAAIREEPAPGRLLHLRGEEARGGVAERLVSAGIETVSVVVYRQLALPMPDAGRSVLEGCGPVILPVFSPESGRRLVAAIPTGSLASISLAVMSPAVAKTVRGIKHAGLWIARQPDAEAMLDAIAGALVGVTAP